MIDAQDVLDDHARQLALAYAAADPGSLALPPLWYAFDSVGIDIDLSTEVVRTSSAPGQAPQTQLVCRTLNPLLAGLLTVPGLDQVKAQVLYEAGIHDVATLAAMKPATVVSRYAKAAAVVDGAGKWRPKPEDAARWVEAAKSLTQLR